ncbi:MAG TPA: class I adenylate-forming enzyme family protein [Opitutaceae bacterium]|jgi:acyl-coenzyme A synthetase/AMP-(fatty) acid ligase
MMALHQAWQRQWRRNPRAVALVDAGSGRRWTRDEVESEARRWGDEQAVAANRRLVCFSAANGLAWWAAFLGALRSGRAAAAIDPAEPPEAARELAARASRRLPPGTELVKLTSGSTGRPRALAFTGEQMLADGRQIRATMGIHGNDTNLGLIPFGHSYGLGNLVLPLLAGGVPILCGVPPLPHGIAEAAVRHGATVFPAVPAVLRALADSDLDRRSLGALRLVISAGAPLEPAVAERFFARFGCRIHNFYGSSETGGIAFDRTGEATLTGRSAGRPLRGVRIAFEANGRFRVAGAAVMGAGAHRPADRARPGARGELTLIGRTGRTIKIAGRRVDPAEIEAALRRLAPGADCCVLPHPRRPDALAAVVAGPPPPPAGGWSALLRPALAPWKIPRHWVTVAALPVNGRGKIDRAAIAGLLG